MEALALCKEERVAWHQLPRSAVAAPPHQLEIFNGKAWQRCAAKRRECHVPHPRRNDIRRRLAVSGVSADGPDRRWVRRGARRRAEGARRHTSVRAEEGPHAPEDVRRLVQRRVHLGCDDIGEVRAGNVELLGDPASGVRSEGKETPPMRSPGTDGAYQLNCPTVHRLSWSSCRHVAYPA